MPRHPRRVLASVLFVAGAALAADQTGGQGFVKMESKPPSDPTGKLAQLREGRLKVGGPDLKANQQLFRDVAKFHVYKATDEKFYNQPDSGDLKARDISGTFDQVMVDVGAQLLTPGPETKYSSEQKEYIAEFGAALNEAIRDVLKSGQPTPVRVNCGRLLALGARSGAPAFAGTIHELLTNSFPLDKGKPAKTPPELLLYAIRAAGNLFAAYDAVWHLNPDARTQFRHSFAEKDQIALARDLITLLDKGTRVAELAAEGAPDKPIIKAVKPDTPAVAAEAPMSDKQATIDAVIPNPEEAAVTAYYRRAVVAALTKIRSDMMGEVGEPPIRPVVSITKVAVGDAALNPPPTTPEVAEAVLGLCYLSPSQKLNLPEVLADIAAGARRVAIDYNIRTTDPVVGRYAQIVPWKPYAERLRAACDHLTTQANRNPRWREHRAAVAQLVSILRDDIVAPLSRGGDDPTNRPKVEQLTDFIKGRQGLPPAERSLYTDDPSFVINPRQGS